MRTEKKNDEKTRKRKWSLRGLFQGGPLPLRTTHPPSSSSFPSLHPSFPPSYPFHLSSTHASLRPYSSICQPGFSSIYLSAVTSVSPSQSLLPPSVPVLSPFFPLARKKHDGRWWFGNGGKHKETNSNYTATLNPPFPPSFLGSKSHSLHTQKRPKTTQHLRFFLPRDGEGSWDCKKEGSSQEPLHPPMPYSLLNEELSRNGKKDGKVEMSLAGNVE